MKHNEIHFRSELLQRITDKKYSISVKHAIMLLFGNIKPEQKEQAAKKAIPIIEQAASEKEAYNKIEEMIKQMT